MTSTDDLRLAELAARLPAVPERDELLRLARVGAKFLAEQRGRKPGFLHRYVHAVAAKMPPPLTFAALIDELESEAVRRSMYGQQASPVERVNRLWELVIIHGPKGERQVPFKTLRNILTTCRKKKLC